MAIEIVANGMIGGVIDDEPCGRAKRGQRASMHDHLWPAPIPFRGEAVFAQLLREPIESLCNKGIWRRGEVEIDAKKISDPDEGDDEDGAGNESLGQDDGVGLEGRAVCGFFGSPELSARFFDNGPDDALRLF